MQTFSRAVTPLERLGQHLEGEPEGKGFCLTKEDFLHVKVIRKYADNMADLGKAN